MEVQTFRAASLQEALRQVRESLGPDASVLHTREIRRSRLGWFPQSMIEVEASVDMPVASRFASHRPSAHPSSSNPRPADQRDLQSSLPPAASPTAVSKPAVESMAESTEIVTPRGLHRSNSATDSTARPTEGPPSDTFLCLLSNLIEAGIEARLAKSLLVEAAERCRPEDRDDLWLLKVSLNQTLTRKLQAGGSISVDPDEQRVAALVGPTGVGKTTTLAKIAAGLRFDLGCQVGLITLDTFRLGAVDQLLQYAELISAPLEVVSSPDQVTPALGRLRECDVVLMDTAGRAPRDSNQLNLLSEFLEAAQPDSTHLVLSANSACPHVADTLEKFKTIQPSNLIITKLDEAVDFGSWMSLLLNADLPVSYMTHGQQVPQDIVVASPRRLAQGLLGNEARESDAHLEHPAHARL